MCLSAPDVDTDVCEYIDLPLRADAVDVNVGNAGGIDSIDGIDVGVKHLLP